MKKITEYKKTEREALTDVYIPRCPDVQSFHFSLDRIFGDCYDFAGEIHPFYEIVYVLSGSVGITAGEKVYVLNAGQCLMHPPNEFHRIRSEAGTEPHVLNLSFYANAMPDVFFSRIFQPNDALRSEFLEIELEVRDGLHHSNMELLATQRIRLEHWLLLAFREEQEKGIVESPGTICYAEVVRLMNDRLSQNLHAGDIAKLAHISLSKLKKIFTSYAGMGVSRYFTEMKMRRAAEMLRSGFRVGETAAALGYDDQNYFSTVFHRIMGVPPGKYKDL